MERCWTPPCGCEAEGGPEPRLVLYNSLVDRKVPFVPAAGPGSKQISWYTCGEPAAAAADAAAGSCGCPWVRYGCRRAMPGTGGKHAG